MQNSKIQWCDDTVNPVMGCDGCELWPSQAQIRSSLIHEIQTAVSDSRSDIADAVDELLSERFASDFWHQKSETISDLTYGFPQVCPETLANKVESLFRCYAGVLHLRHARNPQKPDYAGHPGYASVFETPKTFPGRMERAARQRDLLGTDRPSKPWLNGLPRTLFVSDMGDALSKDITFPFLHSEIVKIVSSPHGQKHLWLWLTKRPDRMAEFADWLRVDQSTEWPDNLVPMTSVTGRATLSRVESLRRVPTRFRGLSVEPLRESVPLNLEGIDWVIVGGESGPGAHPFDLAWARSLRDQCQDTGAAFFLKQLGSQAVDHGFVVPLKDSHGGNWDEWPSDLRIRDVPGGFLQVTHPLIQN